MKRKKRNSRRKCKNQKDIIISLVSLFFLFSIGYASFNTFINLSVSGTAKRTDYYVSNSGSDVNGDGTLEHPYLTIQKAYNEASKVANIYIMNDISINTTTNFNSDKKITLTSYSTNNIIHSIIKTAAINGFSINLTVGTLTLKDITIDGNSIEDTRAAIYNSATLNILDGATITKFVSTADGGGIRNYQTLNIDGGTISENFSKISGGGINSAYNSILNIEGDTKIINNECQWTGCGIALSRGSVCTIDGGIIDGNKNTGPNAGAGITITTSSSLILNNGIISNNISHADNGGGIRLDNSSFVMNGGIITNNNCAGKGAGIMIFGQSATFTMNGGTISKNTANTNGGVFVSSGTFTYNSGVICENTPANQWETHTTCPS